MSLGKINEICILNTSLDNNEKINNNIFSKRTITIVPSMK